MRALNFIVFVFFVLVGSGCDRDLKPSFLKQIETLKEENLQLSHQTAELKEENIQLSGQVETLSGFDSVEREKSLPIIKKIAIAKRSGFVDKNKDAIKEKLVVYLKTYDRNQDVIKAAGSVRVQLWDLDKTSEMAMLKQWDIAPDQLTKLWMGAFMTDYYRLLFDIDPFALRAGAEYTLKVSFTDYISGNVLKEQKVIAFD